MARLDRLLKRNGLREGSVVGGVWMKTSFCLVVSVVLNANFNYNIIHKTFWGKKTR